MILRGFRYKLAPSVEQETLFHAVRRRAPPRLNLALEQRRDWRRQFETKTESRLNYLAQARELTALRAQHDWIAAEPLLSIDKL